MGTDPTAQPPDFKTLFEKLPDLYLILDPGLRIVAMSDAYAAATMLDRETAVGKHIFDALPDNPDDSARDAERNSGISFNRVLETGAPDAMVVQRHDVRSPESEGGGFVTRYWSPVNYPLLNADGSVAYVIHRVENVTDYVLLQKEDSAREKATDALRERARRMEAELYSRSRQVAEASTRLKLANTELARLYEKSLELDAFKTQFFANVSHELRTPLSLILGPVEMLLADDRVPPQWRHHLGVVQRNAQTLLAYVTDLLDLSRLDAGRMRLNYRRVDLCAVVRSVADHFASALSQRGIDLQVTGCGTLEAEIDPAKISRVLINLISNALKHVPPGAGRVGVGISDHGGNAVIEVSDNGPGVAPETRQTIFDRFVQGSDAQRDAGTGLGLAIAQEFAVLHGGTIAVTDAPEGGALFRVNLPLVAPQGTAVLPAGEQVGSTAAVVLADVDVLPTDPRPELSGGRPREDLPCVLVVEDNPDLRSFIADALRGTARVSVATDGEEGLAEALRLRPDLVVADIMMPKKRGDEMIRDMRATDALRDIPVMVLSARADDPLRIRLLQGQAQDYLVKPFAVDELRARVANLLQVKRARDVLQAELSSREADVGALAADVAALTRRLRAAADEMRMARDRAEDASRAKTMFLNMVSHELRTPLTQLEIQLAVLKRRLAGVLGDAQTEAVSALTVATRRLSGLVTSVLDYSRIESGRLSVQSEPCDVSALVADICADVRDRAERQGLHLTCRTEGDVPPLVSDPVLVRVAIFNLVENAIKFTPTGSVSVEVSPQDGGVRVDVVDTGIGIPPDLQHKVFEPFQHVEDVRHKHAPGVGLGLSSVREIAAALGGGVSLASVPGQGSRFTLTLPAAESTQ